MKEKAHRELKPHPELYLQFQKFLPSLAEEPEDPAKKKKQPKQVQKCTTTVIGCEGERTKGGLQ